MKGLAVPDTQTLMKRDKNLSLSWDELRKLVIDKGYEINPDLVNGPTSSKSKMRLFGKKEEDIRVTLFRDDHA